MAVIKDIARVIAMKHQLKNTDADHFVQMIVEVINEGLISDRQVKIKGFGTFKLQVVKERTSVNVNTGERVVIGEHDKVTFTPDNVMRDIINKPFAQFETVVVDENASLLDGTFELEDDLEETESDNIVEETAELMPENPVEVTPEEKAPEAPVVEEKEETPEVSEEEAKAEIEEEVKEEIREEVKEEEPVVQEQTVTEYEDNDIYDEETDECNSQFSRCRTIFIYYGILINVIVALVAFVIGYMACDQKWFTCTQETEKPAVEVKQEPKKTVKTVSQEKPVAKQVEEKPAAEQPEPAKPEVKEPVKETPVKEQPLSGYDSDPRVRTGAYYIMGTQQEVIVKEGQTLSSISKAYLGPDMECYVEAYNNTKAVKAGDKVKIPKLKLKKSLRK